jgi:hypothetical protein
MRTDTRRARALKPGRWLFAGMLAFTVAGCAGYQKERLHQQFAGATVDDKKIVSKTRYEPIRIVSYVLPNGQIICEGEYGDMRVGCAMQKAQIEKKYNIRVREIVRDSGQTRPVQYDEHYLVLKHPDGTVSTQQVSELQFSQSLIGERLGLTSTDPAARRTALASEITVAENEVHATAAEVQAKEAEKAAAERRLAALKKQGKSGKKGGSGAPHEAEGDLARLNEELDRLKIEHEDKELRLTQLRQERDALDKPPSAPAPASQQPEPQQQAPAQ